MEESNYQRDKRQSLIIRIIICIVVIGLIGFLGYKLISNGITNNTDEMGNISVIFNILVYLCVLFVPVLIVVATLKKKRYINKLTSTKPKQRFIYLDTFYYSKMVSNGDIMVNKFFKYHVLKDKDSGKIYAVYGEPQYTNAMFQYINGKVSVLTGKGIRLPNSKSWKEVSFNSEGSLWVEEEINNYLTFDGNKLIFDNFDGKQVLKSQDELSNCNPEYDIFLLKKATFVTGYAEFDMDN